MTETRRVFATCVSDNTHVAVLFSTCKTHTQAQNTFKQTRLSSKHTRLSKHATDNYMCFSTHVSENTCGKSGDIDAYSFVCSLNTPVLQHI